MPSKSYMYILFLFIQATSMHATYSLDELLHLGKTCKHAGLYERAISYLSEAHTHAPEHSQVNWELGDCYLALGDLTKGFNGFAYRWKHDRRYVNRHKSESRKSESSNFAGKKILLKSQWHISNTLLNLRFLKLLQEEGAYIILEEEEKYHALVKHCPYINQIVSPRELHSEHDIIMPIMYLPILFNTTINTIPSATGTLIPDAQYVKKWQQKMDTKHEKSFAVGVHMPEVSSEIKKRLCECIPNLSWHTFNSLGLKQEDYAEELARLNTFDLIITSDNITAMCAACMGKLTWVITEPVTDWFWLTQRADSPWFTSILLFRKTGHDYNSIIEKITAGVALVAHQKINFKRQSYLDNPACL